MDVLVAALIASTALAAALGGIALGARSARGVDDRVRAFIEEENEKAEARRTVYLPAQE